MDSQRWGEACEQSEQSHAATLRSLHRLETALLAPKQPPGEWKAVVRAALVAVIDLMEQHRAAAESPTGVIGLIESTQGHSDDVSEIVLTHETLMADGAVLARGIGFIADGGGIALGVQARRRSAGIRCASSRSTGVGSHLRNQRARERR